MEIRLAPGVACRARCGKARRDEVRMSGLNIIHIDLDMEPGLRKTHQVHEAGADLEPSKLSRTLVHKFHTR